MSFLLESAGSVISSRLILRLRAHMRQEDIDTGGELFSMSVDPARLGTIMFADEDQSGGRSNDLESMEEQQIAARLTSSSAPV